MTYYISGPMSGVPGLNRESFDAASNKLCIAGHHVLSPVANETPHDTYRAALTLDLAMLCRRADALYMLKGWEHSPGARAEHAVAVALKLKIVYEGDV